MWSEYLLEKAGNSGVSILFPEGNDPRIKEAADIIRNGSIADATVLDIPIAEAAGLVSSGEYDGMVAGAVNTTR